MKTLLLIVVIILVGCETPTLKTTATTDVIYGNGCSVKNYEIDGCQYIGYLGGTNCDWCTHKGNCTNPIHKQTYIDTVFYKQILK